MKNRRFRSGAIAAIAALSLVAAACGDDSNDSASTEAGGAAATTMGEEMTATTMGEEMMSETTMGEEMMSETTMAGEMEEGMAMEPTGPACASLPTEGEGSLTGMADDPAATAASNNPELSTLVAAVTAADLVDTLNGPGPFTIFAPANSAFDAIPAADLEALLADTEALTSVLTLHVVAGQMSSADLAAAGSVVTVNGEEITLAAEGDTLSVNGQATVVCADIPTANATVHIIDTVLTPAA